MKRDVISSYGKDQREREDRKSSRCMQKAGPSDQLQGVGRNTT